MDVHGAGAAVVVIPPHLIEEHFAGKRLAGMVGEEPKQLKLLIGQIDRRTVHVHFVALKIDDQAALSKPVPGADTYRVIALGDSFTMGTMIPLEELFVKRVERALNARAEGRRRYEIMNLAFVGWDTSRELRALKEVGLAYSPDAVVVVFYVNDATGLDSNPRIIRKLNAYVNERDGWLNRWSRAWDYTDYLLRRRRVTKQTLADYHTSFFGSEEQQVQWQRSKQALAELKTMSDRRGFRVGVVIFPMLIDLDRSHALSDIYELVEAHCETLGIPTLNLLPEYRGHTPESLWVSPSNAHPNVTANRIAGAAIEKFLVAASLVPDPDGEGWER